jgi:hypothetical protein
MNFFEIIQYEREDGYITVSIESNRYTDDEVTFDEDLYHKYLKSEDKLYYETNEIVNGQLVSKSFTLTLDEYFNDMAIMDISDDLHEYIAKFHARNVNEINFTLPIYPSILKKLN